MTDVFVSYSKKDRERVEPLVRAVEGLGWSVFWDRRIPAGENWREYVGAAVQRAKCVLVLWSSNSIKSRYVLEEAELGFQRKALVPALLDDVAPPFGFSAINAADLRDWDGSPTDPDLVQLLDDVSRLVAPSPTPAGVPSRPLTKVRIENRSTGPILFVRLKEAGSTDWGSDRLPLDPIHGRIPSGEAREFEVNPGSLEVQVQGLATNQPGPLIAHDFNITVTSGSTTPVVID